jgi:hypothetical protein
LLRFEPLFSKDSITFSTFFTMLPFSHERTPKLFKVTSHTFQRSSKMSCQSFFALDRESKNMCYLPSGTCWRALFLFFFLSTNLFYKF